MPRQPKDPAVRQRRNRSSTRAQLVTVRRGGRKPALPRLTKRRWHPLTRAWWNALWGSPMAQRYLPSDVRELVMLAVLVDDFWKEPSKELAGEIRLQRAGFGLTPLDRHRLEWEIKFLGDDDEEPPDQPKRSPRRRGGGDPRVALHAVQ